MCVPISLIRPPTDIDFDEEAPHDSAKADNVMPQTKTVRVRMKAI